MAKFIDKLKKQDEITREDTFEFQTNVLEGKVKKADLIKVFKLYESKKLTSEELLGMVQATQERMVEVDITDNAIDTAGTGGDEMGTFNISTAAAIVIAAAGIPVVKHGNRSASSKAGSADVLEELDLNLDMTPAQAKNTFEKTGITFFYAPKYHPAFKNAIDARKEYGKPTYFNLVGPLVNPAKPKYQILGVSDHRYIKLMGETLVKNGIEKAWIIHDADHGMDELNPFSKNVIFEYSKDKPKGEKMELSGAQFELDLGKIEDLRGGIVEINAAILRNVLNGRSNPSQRSAVVFNAAAGIMLYGKTDEFKEAIKIASEAIDSEKAIRLLENFTEISYDE